MQIRSNWREVVKLIDDAIGEGESADQGLGMKFLGETLGPLPGAGVAHWQAGNCEVFINSWRGESESVIDLIKVGGPANEEALATWERLRLLLANAGLVEAREELPGHEDPRATKKTSLDGK